MSNEKSTRRSIFCLRCLFGEFRLEPEEFVQVVSRLGDVLPVVVLGDVDTCLGADSTHELWILQEHFELAGEVFLTTSLEGEPMLLCEFEVLRNIA